MAVTTWAQRFNEPGAKWHFAGPGAGVAGARSALPSNSGFGEYFLKFFVIAPPIYDDYPGGRWYQESITWYVYIDSAPAFGEAGEVVLRIVLSQYQPNFAYTGESRSQENEWQYRYLPPRPVTLNWDFFPEPMTLLDDTVEVETDLRLDTTRNVRRESRTVEFDFHGDVDELQWDGWTGWRVEKSPLPPETYQPNGGWHTGQYRDGAWNTTTFTAQAPAGWGGIRLWNSPRDEPMGTPAGLRGDPAPSLEEALSAPSAYPSVPQPSESAYYVWGWFKDDGSGDGGGGGAAPGTAGATINHHITFSGPAFVPTSTDESSARETTGATPADVGIDPFTDSLAEAKAVINPADLPNAF